ncbi:MAG: hypothetical protein M1838_000020 [Thelocarpon superellum]|nr:MAG: hypothetical protein M1838_000020 [Thelocarpon superellum]
MTELSFAKSFLATLDSRPITLPSDHVEDARNYPARPAYILPKSTTAPAPPPSKRAKLDSAAPGAAPSVTVTLKSLRTNPPLDLTLTGQSGDTTTILDLKRIVAQKLHVAPEKVKVLHHKKPCGDLKVLKDLLAGRAAGGAEKLELGVMLVGGAAPPVSSTAASSTTAASTTTSVGQGDASGLEELGADAFWDDLKAFLFQRLRNEAAGETAVRVFREAWLAQKDS